VDRAEGTAEEGAILVENRRKDVPGAKALVDPEPVMPGLKSWPISEASFSAERLRAAGLVSYTPVGDEELFDGVVPEGFALVAQREGDFGQRLLGAAEDILAAGFGSVCLIDSDSPTVPRAAYAMAVRELAREGERVVLGPAQDGGYYLIGMKRAERRVFEGIAWSTGTVFAETCARARAARIEVAELPLWYDVDDAATLEILRAELLGGMRPGFAMMDGYDARWTREFLMGLGAATARTTRVEEPVE
jgi:hypothetical protein